MGNLDSAGLESQREIDHFDDAVDIGAMYDKIDGQHQPEPHRFGRERVLALERTLVAGDTIRRNGIRILDRELDMAVIGKGEIFCASVPS